jgi:hypothetical protein
MEMRLMYTRFASNAACMLLLLAGAVPLAAQPKITLSNGATSAAIWYFGPGITGTVPNGYLTFQTLQATYPADTNPNPTITWSTNQPSLLRLTAQQFTNKTSYYIAQATGPSFTTRQLPPPTYNISVVETWDGVKSASFLIFINMPYSNNAVNEGQYCDPPGTCDCNAGGAYPGDTGYVTLNNVYTEDLFGNYITKTNTNEVLFNQLYLGTGNWTSALGNPGQGNWPPARWNSQITFPDYYYICTSNPSYLSPPPTSSGSGGTEVFSETQNYYIGSTTNGQGLCTQASAADLYTNHGEQSNIRPPAYPATVCANRTPLNSKP